VFGYAPHNSGTKYTIDNQRVNLKLMPNPPISFSRHHFGTKSENSAKQSAVLTFARLTFGFLLLNFVPIAIGIGSALLIHISRMFHANMHQPR